MYQLLMINPLYEIIRIKMRVWDCISKTEPEISFYILPTLIFLFLKRFRFSVTHPLWKYRCWQTGLTTNYLHELIEIECNFFSIKTNQLKLCASPLIWYFHTVAPDWSCNIKKNLVWTTIKMSSKFDWKVISKLNK